ncbi:uncharacterized protein C8R40DRAFT_1263556 [Lentinula edodes]|uniref:uncharacterized protein n=1 Tax=Lentinula edodes TaxID=5353 RepID=UPI001E8D100F|nr:uncharacterized protein C8R40DRAFT_1263556 [Lentinula edodes]KAH7878220.1 hypothetical protein C8R40DRAFT_1263556 [Lentinula edodes]
MTSKVSSNYDVCLYFLAIILPPLSVLFKRGCAADFWINICLSILGWIPGIIHAWELLALNISSSAMKLLTFLVMRETRRDAKEAEVRLGWVGSPAELPSLAPSSPSAKRSSESKVEKKEPKAHTNSVVYTSFHLKESGDWHFRGFGMRKDYEKHIVWHSALRITELRFLNVACCQCLRVNVTNFSGIMDVKSWDLLFTPGALNLTYNTQ